MATRKPTAQGKQSTRQSKPRQQQNRSQGASNAKKATQRRATPRQQRPATPRQIIARSSGKRATLRVRDSIAWDDGSTHIVHGTVERGVSDYTPWVLRLRDGSTIALLDVFNNKAVLNPWIVDIQIVG